MRHEPDVLAARFLARELGRAQRWRFQRHLVDCEDCWAQVRAARAGRAALESLREAAPATVRDRVRAVAELGPEPADRAPFGTPFGAPLGAPFGASFGAPLGASFGASVGRPRRAVAVLTAAALVVLAVVGVTVVSRLAGPATAGDPAIAQVVAGYRGGAAWAPAADPPPAAELAGLRWVGTTAAVLDGARVLGHRYERPDHTTVLVVLGGTGFDEPPGARPVDGGDWVTEVDGVTVLCTVSPASLVVGTDPASVTGTARALVGGS